MAEKRCLLCGCASFHYNPRRMRMECSMCGHSLDNEQEQQRRQTYDRSLLEAEQHLRVGNYDTALSMYNSLKNQYPADSRIYQGIQRAATNDFQLDVGDITAEKLPVLADSWDKLIRLNSMKGSIRRYGYKIHARRVEKTQKKKNMCDCIMWLTVILFIITFILGMMGQPEGVILGFMFFIYGCVRVYHMKPEETKQTLEKLKNSSNPYK